MTKAQELAALKAFTDSLPDDSYLKPWLTDVRAEVTAEIISDLPVSPSIAATRKTCAEILQAAHTKAASMVAEAKRESERLLTQAEQARMHLRNVIHAALANV